MYVHQKTESRLAGIFAGQTKSAGLSSEKKDALAEVTNGGTAETLSRENSPGIDKRFLDAMASLSLSGAAKTIGRTAQPAQNFTDIVKKVVEALPVAILDAVVMPSSATYKKHQVQEQQIV